MKYNKYILLAIIILASFLRIYGLHWDNNQHLNPDERFITMVGMATKIPTSVTNYLNPKLSTLNPYNVNYDFYVYGTLPLTITVVLSTLANMQTYDNLVLVGRLLSAFFDIGVLLFVYLLVFEWEKRFQTNSAVKYIAAFFYAIAVLPIQYAHFFVTDSFLVFFVTAAVYFMTLYINSKKASHLFFSGLFFGFGLASKISAIYSAPLLSFFFLLSMQKKQSWRIIIKIILFIGVVYCALRVGDPRLFANASFFDVRINPQFITNIKDLNSLNNSNAWFPPGLQWIHKRPIFYALSNMVFFGVGIPYFILTSIGGYVLLKKKKTYFILLLVWIIGFFIYQSSQYVKSIRYFLVLYPYLAILAGFGFVSVQNKLSKYPIFIWFVLASVLIWPISFMSIYIHPHSRITASKWIYTTIPQGAYLAQEHWDDALPLTLQDQPDNLTYQGEQMPVFDSDSDEKWTKMNAILTKSDYYVLTSSRAYRHILANPERYPKMSIFYKNLFSGKTQFKKVAEFHSFPTLDFGLFKFEFNDTWSDEGFTVFDHPVVTIFKKVI